MIFEKFNLGKLALSNRIVMAPMTRTRSRNGIMTDMNAEYYRQRASVGLIISEGTSISASSMGYLYVPGLYNAAQIESWKKVTKGVHEQGGKIFTQLWHVGRVSHVSNQPNHFDPVAPSAIQAKDSTACGIEDGREGRVQVSTPRALEIAEIFKDLVPNLFRQEYAKMTAVLCRHFGLKHIQIAEDIASDTFLKASQHWAIHGVPENPVAWLYTVAKNKTRDYFKHLSIVENQIKAYRKPEDIEQTKSLDFNEQIISDSLLAMIFVVCNPINSQESQIALALQILCGFSLEEISNAFITKTETIKKRLFRARNNLRNDKLFG